MVHGKIFDPKFSGLCLDAAQRAWKAAKANPNKFALRADTNGGGPYDDDKLDDEFYWAAAELFITTGEDASPLGWTSTENSERRAFCSEPSPVACEPRLFRA